MTEPTVTISLKEYDNLRKTAQSREAGLVEVEAYMGYADVTYFLPAGEASDAMKEEAERLRGAMKDLAATNTVLRTYICLPWYKRIFAKPPAR